jgi:hypothetical protein
VSWKIIGKKAIVGQVRLYAEMVSQATGQPATAVLMKL